jgi:hypothetical protein
VTRRRRVTGTMTVRSPCALVRGRSVLGTQRDDSSRTLRPHSAHQRHTQGTQGQ